jgi:hypothetical protein
MLLAHFLLAVLAIPVTFSPTAANALSRRSHHQVQGRAHDALVNKKRSVRRSCNTSHPPTTTTTTTTAQHVAANTQPTPSSGGNGGRGKVGLAWANGDTPDLANFVTDQVSHIYTWGPTYPSNAKELGLIPMPMLWGDRVVQEFAELVVEGYANIAMGPNEPNEKGQSNMSPQHGAYLWQTYMQPLKEKGYTLLAPVTSSNPNGMTWMKEFMAACKECTFDAMPIHYYDVTSEGFIQYATLWHHTFNMSIWPTEFACQNFNGGPQCTQTETDNFMEAVTQFCRDTDWVANYFAFGVMTDMQGVNPDNQLMNDNGQPTALGYRYINAD